jgi:dihydrofolate reductase
MGKLISITSLTVDGLIDVGNWFVSEGDHDDVVLEQWQSSAAMLTGRTTYEGFLGFWPDQTGPWAEMHKQKPKWIASRSLEGPLDWNSTAVPGDAVDGVAALKEQMDGDLLLTGCGELARTLIQHRVVDEIHFWVHPAIGGPGNRPFQGAVIPMRHLGSRSFDSGVTHLRYSPVT